MINRSVPRWIVAAALTGICWVVGCRDQLLNPALKPSASRRSSDVAASPGCQADCVLVYSVAPLRAARPLADSVGATITVASDELVGAPGDSVLLKVDVDDNVLASVGAQQLVVDADGQSKSYPLMALIDSAIVVYRFEARQSIRVSYRLTRHQDVAVPDGQFRVDQLTSAVVRRLFRPWLSGSSTVSAFSATQCPITAASGAVCGVGYTVSPFYSPPNIGGTFTSHSGTGASSSITIIFSIAVDTVSATIYDPTYPGNTMVAYDSTGAQIGSVAFSFSGQPGVNVPDTEILIAEGIRRIDLIPAGADYVSYDVSFAQPPCPPTNDRILDQQSVRDSLVAAFNRSNPDAPLGTGGRVEHGGVVWQMPDGSYLAQDLTDLAGSNECGNSIISNPTPPAPGATRVAEFHTHPSYGGEPVYGCPRLPLQPHYPQFAGDSGVAQRAVGDANGGGGSPDWSYAFAHNTPEYIINKDGSVWRLDPNTLAWDRVNNANHWIWKTVPGCFMRPA